MNTVVTHSSDHFNEHSETSDEDVLFCISTLYEEKPFETGITRKPRNGQTNFETVIRIESQKVKLLIDSGASINIMNLKTYGNLKKRLGKPLPLRKSTTKVVTYGSVNPSLKIKGMINVLVETKKKYLNTKFYVVDTDHSNLLSGSTAVELGILSLNSENVNTCQNVKTSNHVNKENTCAAQVDINEQKGIKNIPNRLNTLVSKYSQSVFSGKIGKFKNHQVTLHIDKSVPPVAQRERRIPFALREKVNKELDKLVEVGILEEVNNQPTPWLNPLVVVPKGDKDVRICIDMRCANRAITRTRYPTPTVDDILVKVKDSTVFSKLDLNSAFYQLELDEQSRNITSFQSDQKILRSTRLIFGANSAAEELQHALRTVLIDIKGALNIADDKLIFGKNDSEHDNVLKKVLTRLEEKGIKLNLQKCIFSKHQLEFYGYVFTSEGMKPSENKIKSIKDAARPEDQKAVRSFLGLTNYLKRFIQDYSTKTFPLRQLLKHDSKFAWTTECEKSFQTLKTELSSNCCLSYFDESKETCIYTDASPFGISAILLQKSTDDDYKVISYSSRALTEKLLQLWMDTLNQRSTTATRFICFAR